MPNKNSLSKKEGKLIGKITHYFDKAGVAVVKLSGALKTGDEIRIAGGEVDFTQPVESMQIDRQPVNSAKSGDSIGLKVKERVRDGYKVYKL